MIRGPGWRAGVLSAGATLILALLLQGILWRRIDLGMAVALALFAGLTVAMVYTRAREEYLKYNRPGPPPKEGEERGASSSRDEGPSTQ